jgi:hypothetical protein
MKIAVTSQGKELDSQVDPVLGGQHTSLWSIRKIMNFRY